uniref:hypothetical protein n=1 Tax=Prevotella sp. TaxID=59823 RepID=UPI0040277B2A
MAKHDFYAKLLVSLLAIVFQVQSISAQSVGTDRKLEVVSFGLADNADNDTRKDSNFRGKLANTALVKVFMPGEVENVDPEPVQIERKTSTGGGGIATYIWLKTHRESSTLSIMPKNSDIGKIQIDLTKYGISKWTYKNRNGGLQAGKVYRLVLRDPAPVLIDTQLPGAYAVVNGSTKKYYADSNGRITIDNAPSGERIVTIYAADGTFRETVEIKDETKIYTHDCRRKYILNLKTMPEGARLVIKDGEMEMDYKPNMQLAEKAYEVIAYFPGNPDAVKNMITLHENTTKTIYNTKTYTVTPMYNGSQAGTSASVFENDNMLRNTDDGVVISGNSYEVTRPIGQTFKYYATYYGQKSKSKSIKVSANMPSDIQLAVETRKDFQWPWEREYNPTPIDISMGYVQKQIVTSGNGEKVKESPAWFGGDSKWLHGFQIGIGVHPCFKFGLGFYSGVYYEMYISSNDEYDLSSFQEHNIYIPAHALFRIPFGDKVALWVHGGLGFNIGIAAAYKADDSDYNEDITDYYGESVFNTENFDIYGPKRLNMTAEIGLNIRIKGLAIGATYSKGITDNECYQDAGDGYKTKMNKLAFNIAYTF